MRDRLAIDPASQVTTSPTVRLQRLELRNYDIYKRLSLRAIANLYGV